MDIIPLNSNKLFPDPRLVPPVEAIGADFDLAKKQKEERKNPEPLKAKRPKEAELPEDPFGKKGGKIDRVA